MHQDLHQQDSPELPALGEKKQLLPPQSKPAPPLKSPNTSFETLNTKPVLVQIFCREAALQSICLMSVLIRMQRDQLLTSGHLWPPIGVLGPKTCFQLVDLVQACKGALLLPTAMAQIKAPKTSKNPCHMRDTLQVLFDRTHIGVHASSLSSVLLLLALHGVCQPVWETYESFSFGTGSSQNGFCCLLL